MGDFTESSGTPPRDHTDPPAPVLPLLELRVGFEGLVPTVYCNLKTGQERVGRPMPDAHNPVALISSFSDSMGRGGEHPCGGRSSGRAASARKWTALMLVGAASVMATAVELGVVIRNAPVSEQLEPLGSMVALAGFAIRYYFQERRKEENNATDD